MSPGCPRPRGSARFRLPLQPQLQLGAPQQPLQRSPIGKTLTPCLWKFCCGRPAHVALCSFFLAALLRCSTGEPARRCWHVPLQRQALLHPRPLEALRDVGPATAAGLLFPHFLR